MARSTWGTIVGSLVAFAAACASPVESTNNNSGDNYAGDVVTSDDGGDDGTDGTTDQPADPAMDQAATESVALATGCPAYHSDVYTPFKTMSSVSSGTVAQYPWRGNGTSYPDTVEDFRSYNTPSTVECGSDKGVRDYLDVTAGCLGAKSAEGGKVGEIHGTTEGYYRSFALPYDPSGQKQVAWTDMGVEYRFKYSQWTGDVSNPGFKAFGRYLTEYDLYVGSWRMDGVVQIQKKHCGEYTILKRDANYGPPAPNVWHTIRFETVGNQQRLYLDGRLAMTTTDDTIKRGTAGIRIDSAEGAFIDDWHVYAP